MLILNTHPMLLHHYQHLRNSGQMPKIYGFDDIEAANTSSGLSKIESDPKVKPGKKLKDFDNREILRSKPVLRSTIMKLIFAKSKIHDELLFLPHKTRPFVEWMVELTPTKPKSKTKGKK